MKTEARNTYILALDGDVKFKPNSIDLLMQTLEKNKRSGAVCARMHPTGSGPVVWFQMFEYIISHWFLKAAEHVLGCVLCSPGCFSMYKADTLMDDNVIGKMTVMSKSGMDCIKHDQGKVIFVDNQ